MSTSNLKTKDGKDRCVYSYTEPDGYKEVCLKALNCKICGYCHGHCGGHLGVPQYLIKGNEVKG